jgi:hypothetical protein
MRRIGVLAAMLVAALGLVCGEASAQLPSGATAFSPGKDLDFQSWRTLVEAMKPANGSALAFECWATDGDTFSAGTNPPTWPTTCDRVSPRRFQASRLAVAHAPPALRDSLKAGDVAAGCIKPNDADAGKFPKGSKSDCIAEEVRRNQLSFNYIVSHNLYTTTGLQAAFSGPAVAFPPNAVELKADWVPVATLSNWLISLGLSNATPTWVMANYYITTSTQTPDYSPYALVAVHISLKTTEHPDWVWATFEHQNNPGRCDTMGCYDQFAAVGAGQSIAPNTTVNQQYPPCAKSLEAEALFRVGGVSQLLKNYCLKETQVAPTQGTLSVLDGNSVTERITAGVPIAQASCLTCHAYAAVLSNGTIAPNNPGLSAPAPIGAFTIPGNQKQIDFVWGIVNAN